MTATSDAPRTDAPDFFPERGGGAPAVLAQFARDLAGSALSPRALLEHLTTTAADLVGAEGSCVLELKGDVLVVAAPSGATREFEGMEFRLREHPSLFRELLASRKPLLVNSDATDSAAPHATESAVVAQALKARQMAAVPILADGAVSGILLCINAGRGAFTRADIDMLSHLADHSALVLLSQRLVQRAELAAIDSRHRAEDAAQAARHNAVLARTARVLADAVTREGVYDGLARVLTETMRAAGFSVYDANPQLRSARLEYQWGAGQVSAELMSGNFWRSRLGRALDSGVPAFLENLPNAAEPIDIEPADNDAGRDAASLRRRRFDDHSFDSTPLGMSARGISAFSTPATGTPVNSTPAVGVPSVVGMPIQTQPTGRNAVALLPLVLDGRPHGLLSVRFSGLHRFSEEERQLLRDIATQVVLAFRNAVNLAELERRAQRLAALTRAQQMLTHVVSEDILPSTIAEAVRLVIPSTICDILASTRDGLSRALMTRDGAAIAHGPVTELELTLAQETFETGYSRLAVHSDETRYWARGSAELCAVVKFGTRSTGVLRLLSSSPDAFDLQDLDLLTILARQAGTAVETSRLFTLSDFQRQRAEGAAELARVTLQALSLSDGANELLTVLDRFVPSIGKAIGVARARDGLIEFVAASGTLDVLRGHRPGPDKGVSSIAPDGRPRELASLRDVAPEALSSTIPDEWGFVVPLAARDRTLGVLVVSSPRKAPLNRRDRITLERLSTSLALAIDALLLDEEERLSREREHLLATALTTIDHPIFILDHVGVRYANPAAAREYGWSQTELMELRFEQLIVQVRPEPTPKLEAPSTTSQLSLIEHVHRRRDGTEFPAVLTISPLTAQDGEQLGNVVSVRNVSVDRRMAEQLRHTEKMVALGELVAGVAHEINNPLTGISAFSQILLEESLSDDQRESVQLIKQESDRAKTVIRDLLIFAQKPESGATAFDLNLLIEQTLRLRAYQLRTAGIRVELQLDSMLPRIPGDVQQMQQVLLNLIANAEFAMSECDVRVFTVQTVRSGPLAVLSATDTGRGMSADVRQRIFEPFFTTKPERVSHGLGLSVSYGIVQAHNGTIEVQSELDQGTTVKISLPVVGAGDAALDDMHDDLHDDLHDDVEDVQDDTPPMR